MKAEKCLSYVVDCLKENGFERKGRLLIKRKDNVLYIMSFYSPSGTVYCTYCVMPLYMPFEAVTLTYGDRMNTRFYSKENVPSHDLIEKYRSEFIQEFYESAKPYFSWVSLELQHDELSIDYNAWKCSKAELFMFQSYTYLYRQDIKKAKKSLSEYLNVLTLPNKHKPLYTEDALQRSIKEIETLQDLTDKTPDVITNYFEDTIRQNEKMLGIGG